MKHTWKRFLCESELKTVGVVVCLDDEQRFLIIRRSDIDHRAGQWTMPGGHIDTKDNSIEAGASRELKEEASLNCAPGDLVYLGRQNKNKHYFWAKKWSGTVDISSPNPETDEIEHDDYKWVLLDEIKEIEDTKIPIYLLEKALDMSKNAK